MGTPMPHTATTTARMRPRPPMNNALPSANPNSIIIGKPMREIEAEATYGIRVIGSQCYYEQILLGPAELCRRLSGPTVPVTISSTTSTPAPVTLPTTKKKEESVWATLKALPILGQLLKDG
eukprot:03624.XXX_75761_76552_1 [CDS] Oithona nana genome sequencing.